MKLIEHFDALIKAGVVLHFKIAAAGDNVQLDIIPVGKDSKTGVSLPPQALVGSAAEIDAGLGRVLAEVRGHRCSHR
jgi:PRTRC genetic system protein E